METSNPGSKGHLHHEGSWTCHRCGWVYPNPHPSAKLRRNHKKNCGKLQSRQAKPLITEGSSDEASSEDEGHSGKNCRTEEYSISPVATDQSSEQMHTFSPKKDMDIDEHGRGVGKESPELELRTGSETLQLHKLSNDSAQVDDTSSCSLVSPDGYQIQTNGKFVPNAAVNEKGTDQTCVTASLFQGDFDDSTYKESGNIASMSQSVIVLESNLASDDASSESVFQSLILPESNLVSNNAASESALGEREEGRYSPTILSNQESWRLEEDTHSSPETEATAETLSKELDGASGVESAQFAEQQIAFNSVCEQSSNSENVPKEPVVTDVMFSQCPQEEIIDSSAQVINSLGTESVLEEKMLGKNESAIASESLNQHINTHGISSMDATLSETESGDLIRGTEMAHERLEESSPQLINGKSANEYENQVLGNIQSADASDAVFSESGDLKHGSEKEHEDFKGMFRGPINEELHNENENMLQNKKMDDVCATNLEITEKEPDSVRMEDIFSEISQESQNHALLGNPISGSVGVVRLFSQNDNAFNGIITRESLFVEAGSHKSRPMIEDNKEEKFEDNLYVHPGVGVNVKELESGSSATLKEGSSQEYSKAVVAETTNFVDEMETFVDAPESLETCSVGASVDDNESLDGMHQSTSEKMEGFLNGHGSEPDFNEQAYEEAFDLAPDAEGEAKTSGEKNSKESGAYFTSSANGGEMEIAVGTGSSNAGIQGAYFTSSANGGEKEIAVGSGSNYADIQVANKRSNIVASFVEDLKAPSPEAWQETETSEEVGEARPQQTGQDMIPESSSSETKQAQMAKKLQKLRTPLRSLLAEEAEKIEAEQRVSTSNKQDNNKSIGMWGSPPSVGKSKPRSFWSHCVCCPAVH